MARTGNDNMNFFLLKGFLMITTLSSTSKKFFNFRGIPPDEKDGIFCVKKNLGSCYISIKIWLAGLQMRSSTLFSFMFCFISRYFATKQLPASCSILSLSIIVSLTDQK